MPKRVRSLTKTIEKPTDSDKLQPESEKAKLFNEKLQAKTQPSKDDIPQDSSYDRSDDKNPSDASTMEENLLCSICLEVIYDCVSLQPCLHSFCAGCCSQWLKQSASDDEKAFCPSCHAKIDCVAKNHMMNNVIQTWLSSHPEKRRSSSDIQRLDALNTIKDQPVYYKGGNQHSDDEDSEEETSSSDYSDSSGESDAEDRVLHIVLPRQNICRECNPNSGSTFVCEYNQVHVMCQCCFLPMPDRRDELRLLPNEPQQQCASCFKVYCDAYWGCVTPGCISTLRDMTFTDYSLVICKNPIETKIMLDWMTSKNITWADLITRMADDVDDDTYALQSIHVSIFPSSLSQIYVCRACGFKEFSLYCYNVRKNVKADELPDAVTRKPNCYWGKNCWTQSKKLEHAQRYNHICEQTRF